MVRRLSLAVGAVLVLVPLAACAVDDGNVGRRAGETTEPGEADAPFPAPSMGEEASSDLSIEDTVFDTSPPDIEGSPDGPGIPSVLAAGAPPIVLYLNGSGATLSPGRNNSFVNTSQLVNGPTTFPASRFANDAVRWPRLVDLVKNHFAAYNVTVVDVEPAAPPYIEAVITNGSPSLIGAGSGMNGISPVRCGVIGASVVLVFDRRKPTEAALAETVAHELGHSLSLSHTQTATDFMSYSSPRLRFEDLDARCGPSAASSQSCVCGGTTQNNHQQLLRFVGASTSQ